MLYLCVAARATVVTKMFDHIQGEGVGDGTVAMGMILIHPHCI